MAQLDRLIRDARAAMKAHGHDPQPAERWHTSSEGRSGATIDCAKCGKSAIVICRPFPNEVNIGGEVVATDCNVATERQFNHSIHDPNGQTGIIGYPEIRMDAVMGC